MNDDGMIPSIDILESSFVEYCHNSFVADSDNEDVEISDDSSLDDNIDPCVEVNDINDDDYVDEDAVVIDATTTTHVHTPAVKLRNQPNCEYILLRSLYGTLDTSNGNLGGNATFGPTYGELTIFAMYKVIRWLINFCYLSRESVFVDVGSGLGKPCLQACVIAEVKRCFGIEVESIRHDLAIHNLNAALKKHPEVFQKKRIMLLKRDITDFESLSPCTHIYSFDAVFPEEVMKKYAACFNATKSAQYLVSFHKPKAILSYFQ
jgi:hypothetical protein